MAIQIRRGAASDFDSTKMVSGELAVSTDGSHKVWATGAAGDCWELVDKEDVTQVKQDIAPAYSTSSTYAVGAYVMYNSVLYRCTTAITTAETWTAAHWTVVNVGSELTHLKQDINELETTKADASGTSENLTAGNAEQLLTDKGVTDKVPYLLRASGGNGADREEDKIVGGTVAWNQLCNPELFTNHNGIIKPTISNGVISITGTPTDTFSNALGNGTFPIIKDHIYLTAYRIVSNPNNLTLRVDINNAVTDKIRTDNSMICKGLSTANAGYGFSNIISGSDYSGVSLYASTFDLTQMFGTTIAIQASAMEQATAGSGINWLKSMGFFQKDYYPYDAGTLKSVEGLTAHSMVGFNQWDEEWESGSINIADGTNVTDANAIRSKNYIPVMPGVTYYFKAPSAWKTSNIRPRFYACDKTYIGSTADGGASVLPNSTFAIPSGCYYMRFSSPSAVTATTYNHDVCVNISDPAKNGTYEPYVKHSYPLDSTLTLRGIPKLDSNNQVYYDGDEYASDGTVTRRYGVVDLGSFDWGCNSTYSYFHKNLDNGVPVTAAGSSDFVNPKYTYSPMYTTEYNWADKDKVMCLNSQFYGNSKTILIKDTAYSDVASFKAAMSGVYLVYPLATATTEEAEPYQNPQIVDPYGTEAYETTGIVPVGHDTFYPENLRAKIEGLPFNFATLIAPTESTYTATRAYSTGNLFIVDNILYKATTSIASGGTITPGTNCTATTLAEIIAALS